MVKCLLYFFSYTLEKQPSSPFVLLKNIIKDKDMFQKKRASTSMVELPNF